MKIDLPAPIVSLHAARVNSASTRLLAMGAGSGPGGGLGERQPARRSGLFEHRVQFYEEEVWLYRVVGELFVASQGRGEPLAVFATAEHRLGVRGWLEGIGLDVEALEASGRLILFDAGETLAMFMVDGVPDQKRFELTVGAIIDRLCFSSRTGRVVAWGEMVDLLWRDGHREATMLLERCWQDLSRRHDFGLLCTYGLGGFAEPHHGRDFADICDGHDMVLPAESHSALGEGAARDREVARLQQKTLSLEGELAHRQRLEGVLRGALADHLLRQNEDLARTVRFGELFVGILGHDLRNPLSAITTAASLIKRRADSDRLGAPAARILNSAGRMERMIDQLLDFARIRLGTGIEVEPQPMDLAALIREAVDDLATSSGARSVEVACVGDLTGRWDRARLLQLVSNLLADAAAPTVGSPGTISIEADGTHPEWVTFALRNPEVVSPEELTTLFEPFRGGGAPELTERSTGLGLGLGLFMSQQIVLAHGGTIGAESSDVLGTRIAIVLPRQSASPSPGRGAPRLEREVQ
jgi:signal transduction histidine kinase